MSAAGGGGGVGQRREGIFQGPYGLNDVQGLGLGGSEEG